MSQEKLKHDCVKAFRQGNKQDAEQLLPWIKEPADIGIKEPADIGIEYVKPYLCYTSNRQRQISLLHMAASNG